MLFWPFLPKIPAFAGMTPIKRFPMFKKSLKSVPFSSLTPVPITVARGDGIGPEIMDATLQILKEGGAKLEIDEIAIGMGVYNKGVKNGIEESSWDSLRRTKIFL